MEDLPEDLTDDERAAVDAVRRFARQELEPMARELDETAQFAGRHRDKLSALGLMAANLPTEYGGIGISPLALLSCVEAVASACAGTASMLTAHFLATDSILIGGNEEQKRRYLGKAATGDYLGAFALTEPAAGSNPADMRSRGVRKENGFQLTGAKHFISNAGEADFLIVFAMTDPDAGSRGVSAFVLERGTPGLKCGPPEPTMGLRAGHIFEVSFDCLVPEEQLLGAVGSGFRTAMKVLDNGRIEVAAMCLGIAQAAFERAVAWSEERIIGGQALATYQGIRWMLADMAVELRAARLLAEDAARKRGRAGRRFSAEASMAKLFASEAAARVVDKALQIHGGYGYSRHLPLERSLRDLRVMRIYEGSSEVQREILSRDVLASRRSTR